MPSRWDFILDQKPLPVREHLYREVTKRIVADLAKWPLPITELAEDADPRIAALFGPESRRPPDAAFAEAFRITRWELEREILAVDEYMRNRRWLEKGLAPEHQHVILGISRWLVESLLSLRDDTAGRVSRAELVQMLEGIASAWSAATASSVN